MAKTETSAVAALARLKDEGAKMQRRIAEARKAAAAELGEAVLAAGAETIQPRDLKALLTAVMKVGPAKALELIAGAGGTSPRQRSNGADNRQEGDDARQ